MLIIAGGLVATVALMLVGYAGYGAGVSSLELSGKNVEFKQALIAAQPDAAEFLVNGQRTSLLNTSFESIQLINGAPATDIQKAEFIMSLNQDSQETSATDPS